MASHCKSRLLASAVIISVGFLVGGCSVPAHMEVDAGLYPENQDEDVRFRTVYYFRTFDVCENQDNLQTPRNDSLYRFRLTGKAASLFNDIHFESGTLDAAQIDPFGAAVAYDKKNRQFYLKSQERVKRDALRSEQYEEFKRLIDLYDDIPGAEDSDVLRKDYLSKIEGALQAQLDALTVASVVPDDVQKSRLETLFYNVRDHRRIREQEPKAGKNEAGEDLAPTRDSLVALIDSVSDKTIKTDFTRQYFQIVGLDKVKATDDYCSDLERGFQVLGPQGWETYDQDSRLLFAMSSTGKPLINTLQELSGRILNAQSGLNANVLSRLVREELAAEDAKVQLQGFTYDDADPDAALGLLENALAELGEKTEASSIAAVTEAETKPEEQPADEGEG